VLVISVRVRGQFPGRLTQSVDVTISRLRAEVAALHTELPRNRLVVWTAGNVSARVPGADRLVIKPSG
jgi:L-ribulose-5-phosphate 4-epimerase